MGFRDKVKKNVPKVDLQSYNIMIVGGYKSGKTRAWKELIELNYPNNPEAGLLLAFEPGYKTWELDSYIDMHNYDWEFFRNEVVKGLIQEAKEGSPTKIIGIDTVDKAIEMCEQWVLNEHYKRYGKKLTTLQEITETTRGELNGYILLKKELTKQFDALKNAGYGFIELAWTKEKETETIDGLKFKSLELNMSKTGKDVFHSQADLVCVLFDEVKVLDKEGNEIDENLKDKKGRDKASRFHQTETYMYFRPTNYISISGGRFVNLPEKEPYSAENFMRVFEEAVKGQLNKTTKSIDDLRKEEIKQREEKAKEFAEEVNKIDEYRKFIDVKLNEIKKDSNLTKQVVEKFKELFGSANGFRKSDDVEALKEAVDYLNSLQ